jgi:hypothetical protein
MSKEETLATRWGEFIDMLNCRAIENGTARQIPPKATCESPSPIKEKRLRTSVTPSREEQREMSTPTIKA